MNAEEEQRLRRALADAENTINAYCSLMMNCADTLRSRGVDARIGPLDIRVIALAKRCDDFESALREIGEYKGEGPVTTPWQDIVKSVGETARNVLKKHKP